MELTRVIEGYGRYAYDGERHVGDVGLRTEGYEAKYWGDLPTYSHTVYGTDRAMIGVFPTADEAVAAVEERHLGRDACE